MDDIKCLLKITFLQKRTGVGERVHLNGKPFLEPCLNLLIFRLDTVGHDAHRRSSIDLL